MCCLWDRISKSVAIQPFDIVMQHPERYVYPKNKDGDIGWIYTAHKKELLFIIVSQSVFFKRHPHFKIDKIKISEEVRNKLKPMPLENASVSF